MSTTAIPDLWPEDIRVDVIDPIAILRVQEAALTNKTHGLLRAEVRSFEKKEQDKEYGAAITHNFDLIAPALGEYRVTLLRAIHSTALIYPVLVQSRVFDPDFKIKNVDVPNIGGIGVGGLGDMYASTFSAIDSKIREPYKPDPEYRQAATQDEFIKLVTEVLQSVWVRSLVQSLIARSNAAISQSLDKNGSHLSNDAPSPSPES